MQNIISREFAEYLIHFDETENGEDRAFYQFNNHFGLVIIKTGFQTDTAYCLFLKYTENGEEPTGKPFEFLLKNRDDMLAGALELCEELGALQIER